MSISRLILTGIITVSLWAAETAVQESKKLIDAKKYDEAIATLEKAEKAKPKSAELQKGLADAHLAHGESFMYNESLPPRMKYPQALRSYRKVLQYDKTNKKALEQIATIEGIYKSMGRPVPQ